MKNGSAALVDEKQKHGEGGAARLSALVAVLVLAAIVWWSAFPREQFDPQPAQLRLSDNRVHLSDSSNGHPEGIKLYVGVLSSAKNSERRMAIRRTWGSDAGLERVVFVVANPAYNETLLKSLRQEALKYRDVIFVGHVVESYYNITYQTLEVFRSAYAYSGDITHVLKCDDDSYVHVGRLLRFLGQLPVTNTFFGYMNKYRPKRNTTSKWFVSKDEWLEDRTNMTYAQGTGYILTKDLADEVATTAAYMCSPGQLFKIEDVALGSWLYCLQQDLGVRVDSVHSPNFNYVHCKKTDIISHHITAQKMACMFAADGKCC